jgi:hypothetical protein
VEVGRLVRSGFASNGPSLAARLAVVVFADTGMTDLVLGSPVFVPAMAGPDRGITADFVVMGMNGGRSQVERRPVARAR